MNFGFTNEQDAFRDSLRKWAHETLAPSYLDRSRAAVFPWSEYKEMAGLGLIGLLLDEGSGGQGADHVTAGIVAEEVAHADFSVSVILLLSLLATQALSTSAAPPVRELQRRVLAGDAVVALALTEPGTGSDLANVVTRARQTSHGWQITGEKSSISLAGVADAAIVLAAIDGSDPRSTGLFVVPLDDARISRQTFEDPGFRAAGRGALAFDGVLVPATHHLGAQGFKTVMRLFDFSRPYLGLACLAAAQASLDEAAQYTTTREAFGRPIAHFQGVAFPLAEHDTFVRAARWICYEALWRRDAGRPHTREAAAAKWFGPKTAFDAAHDALLLHGNLGYTSESPFPQRLLDIMSCEIGDGTAQIQKAVIARELLGREHKSY